MPRSTAAPSRSPHAVAHRAAMAIARRRFVDALGRSLILTLSLAALFIIGSRLVGWEIGSRWWWGWIVVATGWSVIVGMVAAMRDRLSDAQGGGVLDDRLGLKGQIRSAIELETDRESKDHSPGFVALAQRLGDRAASGVDLEQAMTTVDRKNWRRSGSVLAMVLGVGLWMPMRSAGGERQPSVIPDQAIASISSIKDSIDDQTDVEPTPQPAAVQEALEELDSLEEELAKGVDDPAQANAQAAAKLEKLADALDEASEREQEQASQIADRIAEAQNRQQDQAGEPSVWDQQLNDFGDAIEEQDFDQAQQAIDELREQVDELSASERQELADRLEEFADAVEPDALGDESEDTDSGVEPSDGPSEELSQELADSIRDEAEEIRSADEQSPEPQEAQDATAEPETQHDQTTPPDEQEPKQEPKQEPEKESNPEQDQQQGDQQQGEPQQSDQRSGDQEQQDGSESGPQDAKEKKSASEDQQGDEPSEQADAEKQDDTQNEEQNEKQGEEQNDQGEQGQETERETPKDGSQQDLQQGEEQDSQSPKAGDQQDQEQQEKQPEQSEQSEQSEQTGDEGAGRDGEQGREGRSLDEALEDMKARKERAQKNQEQADKIREEVRRLIDPNQPPEPSEEPGSGVRRGDPEQAQQGGGGNEPRDETRATPSGDPDAGENFVPVDASSKDKSGDAEPVGKWYAPDGEASERAPSKMAAAQRLRQASQDALRSVDQQVPRKYRRVVREVFKRAGQRADAIESGSKVAPQGQDATSKTAPAKSAAKNAPKKSGDEK